MATPSAPGSEDVNMTSVGDHGNGNSGIGPTAPKKFFPKKFGGVEKKVKQVPNSVKKKRVNFRLRKIIVPKAPIMVLNEMVGAVNYQFVDNPPMPMMNPNFGPCSLFTAECQVDGQTFNGTGPNKQIAKNICAEHAIQYVVTKRSKDPKNMAQLDEGGNPLKPTQMTDETPWAQLASLALFKLFNDWQAQGYVIPNELLKAPDYYNNQGMAIKPRNNSMEIGPVAPQSSTGQVANPVPIPGVAKKIPENPTERHPVQLLNELRGTVTYQLLEERGNSPSVVFVMGADVNGKTFKGEGKNKKDAKRACAVEILKELHQIIYPEC